MDTPTTEKRDIEWPPGRMDFRKVRNVKPGYILCPPPWADEYRNGVTDEKPWMTPSRATR